MKIVNTPKFYEPRTTRDPARICARFLPFYRGNCRHQVTPDSISRSVHLLRALVIFAAGRARSLSELVENLPPTQLIMTNLQLATFRAHFAKHPIDFSCLKRSEAPTASIPPKSPVPKSSSFRSPAPKPHRKKSVRRRPSMARRLHLRRIPWSGDRAPEPGRYRSRAPGGCGS